MFKPTSTYKFSREIKRLLAGRHTTPEFRTWYKHKIIQADLEHELKARSVKKEAKPSVEVATE